MINDHRWSLVRELTISEFDKVMIIAHRRTLFFWKYYKNPHVPRVPAYKHTLKKTISIRVHTFFNNYFYKNHEAQISWTLRIFWESLRLDSLPSQKMKLFFSKSGENSLQRRHCSYDFILCIDFLNIPLTIDVGTDVSISEIFICT